MTTAKNNATAIARDSAPTAEIAVVSSASIAVDVNTRWKAFIAQPGVTQFSSALISAKCGLQAIWETEREQKPARIFLAFLGDAVKEIALPLLYLLWSMLNVLYVWGRKPETRTAIAAHWQSFKNWLEPKFGYTREKSLAVDDLLEVKDRQ